MTRLLTTAAALLLLADAATAAPFQTTVTARDTTTIHAKLIAAANKLCRAARAGDLDNEFGTQEECVANTVAMAGPVRVLPAAVTSR